MNRLRPSPDVPPRAPIESRATWRTARSPRDASAGTGADISGANILRGDLALPALVLKQRALRHNVTTMAAFCAAHEMSLAPHGKTTMCPQIVALQLDAGAWAITAATVQQAAVFRAFGVRRVLIANQVVDAAALRWLAHVRATDPDFEIMCYVDSVDGASLLDSALAHEDAGSSIRVLLEVGLPGGRTGVRDLAAARALATSVDSLTHLELVGVAGFEGIVDNGPVDSTVAAVDDYLRECRDIAEELIAAGFFDDASEIIISAGGSAFFDRVLAVLGNDWALDVPIRLVLRSGCYVTHDSGAYRTLSPFDGRAVKAKPKFEPALELWAAVLSVPEDGRALVGFGRRDAPFDAGLPVVERAARDATQRAVKGLRVTALNDQHAYVSTSPGIDLRVGDLIGFGISHPCTAFDKWARIPVVDDSYEVVDVYETYF